MHAHEEATKLAREKLERAETALQDYKQGIEFTHERLNQLAQAVVSARRELLELAFGRWPERR